MSTDIQELRRQVQDLKLEVVGLQTQINLSLSLLRRTSILIRRISGDENIDQLISKFQRLIMLINSARMAWHAYQIAQAGAGPLGWALAGIGAIGVAVTAGDIVMELSSS